MSSCNIFDEEQSQNEFLCEEEPYWGYGEEGFPCIEVSKRKSLDIRFPNKFEDSADEAPTKSKSDVCDKCRQTLSERQEIRRKNVFLQKKMIEFFKKRKMDHALKEDPKGLDLESKYLKRLFELQEQKKLVETSKVAMEEDLTKTKNEFKALQQEVKVKQEEYLERQRKVAASLTLKSGKNISTKAIKNFLKTQAFNAEVINRQRFLEIKEKKQLEEKQNNVKDLESLGQGMSRGGYEFLNFQYQNVIQQLHEKESMVAIAAEKAKKIVNQLHWAGVKFRDVEETLMHQKERKTEAETEYFEVKKRLHKIKKHAARLREDQKQLEFSSRLLTHVDLLQDLENTLNAIDEKKEMLSKFVSPDVSRLQGGAANTPESTD